jgi:hypothetical protein
VSNTGFLKYRANPISDVIPGRAQQ